MTDTAPDPLRTALAGVADDLAAIAAQAADLLELPLDDLGVSVTHIQGELRRIINDLASAGASSRSAAYRAEVDRMTARPGFLRRGITPTA